MSGFSDEPVLIEAAHPKRRMVLIVLGVLLVIAAALYPFAQYHWREHLAHEVERGELQGAVYAIPLAGSLHRLELGWAGDRLAFRWLDPLDRSLRFRVEGDAGDDLLEWDPQHEVFGPGSVSMNPYKHHRLDLRIETLEGDVLWSGTRWAYGIGEHGHGH
ncbi:hypothetical protein [Coraliomargarita parva]|uniref:hypothetical protein n=1 Tax=Coraliomargarita parva TaxID=3014050 RepID=UPI0022B55C0A|nr:hypothetical protein [Coraliomargarita parva]